MVALKREQVCERFQFGLLLAKSRQSWSNALE